MSLRRKFMLYVGVVALVLMGILYTISDRMMLRNYLMMEREYSLEGMKRALIALSDEYTNLGAMTINYSGWDETYQFIQKETPSDMNDPYLAANYPDALFTSSRLNLAVLLNNQKQVYFAKAYDFGGNRRLPNTDTYIQTLQKEYASFLTHSDINSRKEGLVVIDHKPMIAASYPILTSDNAGPVRGALLFARFLDDSYIQYISAKADIPLTYTLVEPLFKVPSSSTTVNIRMYQNIPFWTATEGDAMKSYALLSDIEGKPAVLLAYSVPRELYMQARKNTQFFLIFLTLSGIALFIVAMALLEHNIFIRLSRVIGGMKKIEMDKDFSIRIRVSGNDEISQLEKSMNHMMSSLEHAQSEIQYQAHHDVLTGLANRKAFYLQLEQLIGTSKGTSSQFAVLFIDLDGFKTINDTMGHSVGDLLLIQVARRLRACVKDSERLCRLGGDEFCIISVSTEIEQLAAGLKECLHNPFLIQGQHVVISASIGISLYPDHGTTAEQLLKQSDTAMLDVKESGKNNYQWYSAAFESPRARKSLLERQLKSALELGEFRLVYQPKWEPERKKITGAEALLRWNNPVLGQVSPAEFIPIVESSGMIHEVGEWIMREACRQFKRWEHEQQHVCIRIAINISGAQLLHPHFLACIQNVFEEEGVQPFHFELEVTESVAIGMVERVIDVFGKLRSMGFLISLDDFGAGYSSMKYLCMLPVQCMKLDKTLIDRVNHDERSQVIVSTLILMAHQLGLFVVAEGVEQPEQLQLLQRYHCDQIQGYLISRPLEADQLMKMLVGASHA
ncbi:EAL domain-containing protein [Paenibacillus sp. GCM10023248]|uniref:bifunctional diguanylate cyclase/phosphodiesterase n=1 Tax=unclassified Paenibacillus TaxID=185978 RepID=UPI0023785619|nr:EAL domain-containing protein [Paenibacillus sp. MAHUQ-63]MDD9269216.1 EAL domain-containing protein [Paenibacillus sp. MAHUQ-63]